MSMDEVTRRWLRRLVSRALDVEPSAFDELLTGGKAEPSSAELVESFFSSKTGAGSVLFFYKGEEQYDLEEEVEEEVEVIREASPTVQNVVTEAHEKLVQTNVELGCSTGDLLSNLEGIICNVFMPLLDPQLSRADHSNGGDDSGVKNSTAAHQALKVIDAVRNEFKSNLVKFSSQISNAIQQIQGDIHLNIPDVIITKPESHLDDYELINTLEQALEDWSKSVASVVEQEIRKTPKRKGPLAEIEFWRERNATLSTIFEQINMPAVQKMLKLLELVEASMLLTFKYHFSELSKLYVEAKDNVKFLTTLERHFKNIASGSFSAIADTLPSMMNAIRMVWIISRHYNTDERMVPLMERIASEIVDKVAVEINIHTILRKSPENALHAIEEAKMVLELWHSTYMKVRERIEASGTDHRWEFDRKRLFEQTNYMAKICENLQEVATVLDQFNKFLGPELKSVTGDSQGIDDVMSRVEGLIAPFESVPFKIFDRGYKTSWESVMVQFREKVSEIENMTRKFIDTSFQKLRSAEGAFDLLQNFQNIQSRESINKQMMEKYKDILMQYTKELEKLEEQFHRHKHRPLVYKNYPPVAGAISWSRSLYLRAKKPILRFRAMNDLLKSPHGEEVKEKYLVFARAVDAYIKQLHKEWREKVPALTNECLKLSILGPKLLEAGKSETGVMLYKLPQPPFYANFSPELAMIIKEAKYLDRLGFEIPEEALNVTLQEDKYHHKMVEEIVMDIENTLLIKIEDFGGGVVTERIEELVQSYRSIGPLLIKVEEIVAGVNTGTSPKMSTYYMYWERRIFNAITKMIIASMTTFQALLNVHTKDISSAISIMGQGEGATMNGKDIIVTPSLSDMYKYLSKSVKHIVESAKAFIRWMHGTCRETAPLVVNEDEEPITFTFYSDISQNPYVIKMTLSLNQEIHKVFNIVNRYLDSWRRYDTVYNLWNTKRRSALEKLADKKPPCVYFDTRMAQYSRLAESVRNQPTEKDTDFLQINCLPLAVSIAKQAEMWKDDYGKILLEVSNKKLLAISATMDQLEFELESTPEDLESLKKVLNTVASISDMGMEMELEYADIIERYRTLQAFSISGDPAEFKKAFSLEERWKGLYLASKTKDLRLVKVKDQFRGVTKQDAVNFAEECKNMKKEFLEHGPGTCSLDLDAGLDMVSAFKKKLSVFKARRQELANAENLFALPITSYPELQQIAEALEKQEVIYDLYTEQKEFISNLSSMLWAELDVAAMNKGIEELEKRCRKIPKDLKAMSTFVEVEKQILSFKESIPLIQSLKNEAMKPRHWEELMVVTQVRFDMNLKTFTLGNLFAMKLHRFSTEIGEIVNAAMQEQKIEQEILKIEDSWAKAVLELVKYKKNGTDRGWVLRAADDLKITLEDHMLNLQTMSGSRFIASFAERVRKWEKRLGVVNECLDIWFVVQRKWMYLESIFVGAEDIRQQLPEEAKKFDAIDKAWKTIMGATYKNANAVEACTAENRVETLHSLSERLDKCQKSLSDYLDTKRNSFPRFFFISDDELLSVLGSSDPTSIQVHMLKLFDNVKLLTFVRNNKSVGAMESAEGEGFQFRTLSAVEGPVESWMTGVEDEMRVTLQRIAKEGTGKTETVKDLAKSLALPCYVINCGEGLDYKAMGSIFSGLVQVGAWGCFDEFNRINIEVLSVVSAQLRAIQNALNYDKPTVDIGFGTEIAIHRTAGFATCGFFITMNPGYAGRTELPDNLKALFRPVTMIVPDLLQICQIMLFSEGFEHAVSLAKKMTVLYKLSREQLSKQYHYDFGLRALKSVLVMAGSLKREYSDMNEDLVLMRALRDSNMPKFVFEDVPLFHGLINDLFPGLDCPRVGYAALKDAIEAELVAGEYNTTNAAVYNEQIDKIIQMYETMLTHCCMICETFDLHCMRTEKPILFVGESGTAKTVTIQSYLKDLDQQTCSTLNINFSSRTSSLDVQTNIQANVDKRSGKIYGPPAGKKLLIFIDDLNMPKVDLYGTQQPIALLHFVMNRGSIYDRGKELDLRILKDLLFIGAMGPPGGGRNQVDPRFVAQFNVYNLTPPTKEVLKHIYGSIVTTYLRNFSDEIQGKGIKLTEALLQFFEFTLEKLPPTPSKFHYIFIFVISVESIASDGSPDKQRKTLVCHALLIGVGGSGKQSLSRLAAFTAGYDLFEIFLTRGYGEAEFRENLKDLYRMLGKKPVVFLFTDAHAVEEGFLEFINNMLTTGVVPALFETDERDVLANSVRDQVKAAGLVETSESCWRFYVNLCRQNLHVILAMSPSVRVAHQFGEELRRHYYVTPKNYLDFISNYRLQLKENKAKVTASIARLKGGLTKLVEAAQAVDVMQVELSEKKVIVDEKTLACEALIKTIEEKSAVASKQQEVAAATQIECEKASVLIAREKEEADAALLEALPAVEAAAAALQDLSKADLTELKSFASPPPLVMSVCMCVLILKPTGQELDLDWKGAKVMLSNANLITLLKEYEKDKISAKMITKIKTFFKNPDLNIENMKSISRAGAGLLVWVVAIVKYHDVAKNVEPLRLKVKTMEKEQTIKEQELASLKATLNRLKTELDSLSTQFQEANSELQGLKTQADQMQKRLHAATFSFDYRSDLIYRDFFQDIEARKLPVTAPFRLESSLTDDATIQNRFPLCIDPQQQAVNWIKKKEEKNSLTVKTLSDPDFMKHLELAIQFGNPFLFESVDEELDPILDPVLEKSTFMEGSQRLIKLGDKNVEWDTNFRLYFTSKLANPHYSPEVMGKTMIVNYSVTQDGLANQLLNVVVAHERPDLEEHSSGNILDNEELIATLDETKNKATEISAKLELSSFTKDEITKAREVYTPVALRGSIMYFAMAALATIMKMYEISLASFLTVFHAALETAKRDVVLEKRLRFMVQSITEMMYDYTCTGIFERHKLMFSFQMTCMILSASGDLNRAELDFFLKGDTSLDAASQPKPEAITCFRQDRVYNAMKLFVMEMMGEKFVQPPVLDYARIYSQSAATAPIVCILSPGADPQSDIQTLGDEYGFSGHRFKFLALVLERRKYGKIGWNVSYDFNESDFTISRKLLSLYLYKAYEDQDEQLPWGSLKYLIGDAMYGGRVSDDYDRRILTTYLSEYMGDFLFDDCQRFYFSRSGFDYVLPGALDVETLPLTNSPAVFGLHPNAEIGYYTNMSKSVWKDLISLQPRSAQSGAGVSREDHIGNVASDIQSKELDRWNLLTLKY
eukprot:jgi/Phyca11/16825/fgenesh1_pg.PHYCAscaffold_22_\